MFYIIGYKTCHFYQDVCRDFKESSVPFYRREVANSLELNAAVLELYRGCQRIGVSGTTSPQVLKLQDGVLLCMGGYDNVKSIGMKNVSDWFPVLSF
tara:strand:- start:476 stop:766 length:291 start_codon:yes stop_codon:yes gene_type:complete